MCKISSISPDDLLDCSLQVGNPATDFLSGCNLQQSWCEPFKATVHRKRFKKIEEQGDKVRRMPRMNTLKWRSLCLNFDGKQVKQIEDNLDITDTVEKICYQCHITPT